jgi:hypothetical protein
VKGDFSRFTFRPTQRFAAVVMQQGSELLDSDWNEQAAITMKAVRSVVRDLLGPHGGTGDGFRIEPPEAAVPSSLPWDVLIGAGSYYVDGIRCENTKTVSLRQTTAESTCDEEMPTDSGDYLAYLDVWDRYVTAIEDPELRETAIGGPETSSRLQVVWRVRLLRIDLSELDQPEAALVNRFARKKQPGMRARIEPGASYTGLENQLYRVEIHGGGGPRDATFKWSRGNGSVIARVRSIDHDQLVVEQGSTDAPFGVGMSVEPEDETTALCGRVPPLLRIESIEGDRLTMSPPWPLGRGTARYRLIRRWDHGKTGDANRDGAIPLVEGGWVGLEDGIQISFDGGGDYRAGDYWLFPARAAAADIGWPTNEGEPQSKRPNDVEHHRAPLAHLELGRSGTMRVGRDLRRLFRRLAAST